MVDGAIAFLRRDVDALTRCAEEAASLRSPPADYCARLFSVLGASVARRRPSNVQTLSAQLDRRALSAPLPATRSVRPGARRRGLVGRRPLAAAPRRARFSTARGAPPTLDRLFLEWQHAARCVIATSNARRRVVSIMSARGSSRPGAGGVLTCISFTRFRSCSRSCRTRKTISPRSWPSVPGFDEKVARTPSPFSNPERGIVSGDGWSAVDTRNSARRRGRSGRVCQSSDGDISLFEVCDTPGRDDRSHRGSRTRRSTRRTGRRRRTRRRRSVVRPFGRASTSSGQ